MKRFLLLLLFAATARAQFDPAPYRLDVVTARLENGFTVLVSRDPSVSDVAVELWFRVGSAQEGAGEHGLAHLFEHMLPGAAQVLGNPANNAVFESQRLGSNGTTATDYTRMYLNFPAANVEVPIALLADRLAASPDVITAEDLARHQTTVLAEFRNGAGRTWDGNVSAPVRRALFGAEHPYGHSTMGSAIDVESATAESMRRWFRRWYGAANSMLIVVGNADPSRVVELARKHFGSIPAGTTFASTVPLVTPAAERQFLDVVAPEAKPALDLHWRTPRFGDPARQDVALAKELLRQHLSTSLGCEVVHGDEFAGAAGGSTSLRIGCAGRETAVLMELDRFLQSSPSSLARARDERLAAATESLSRLGWRPSRAQLLGEGHWLAGDAHAYLRQLERLGTATPESVLSAANVWLRHPLVVRLAPATLTPAPDRAAAIVTIAPPVTTPADVVEDSAGGGRLITAQRRLPLVLGHVVPRDGAVESFSVIPSRVLETLTKTLERKPADTGVVLVGDVDRDASLALLRARPRGAAAAPPADAARFTAKPGATQTTITAIARFPPETDVARVMLAADLLRTRLNDRLREQERWAYSVDARFERRNGAPAILVEAPIRDDAAVRAIPIIEENLTAVRTGSLTAQETVRGKGAELRRLAALGSAPYDLAQGLVAVLRSGDRYADYVNRHRALYESLREGATLALAKPTLTWQFSGDPANVDPALRNRE